MQQKIKYVWIAVILNFLISIALALEVNSANEQELQNLKGVGPSLAGQIIKERKLRSFKDWDDFIDRVKGVGDKKAVSLAKDGLTVAGQLYKAPAKK